MFRQASWNEPTIFELGNKHRTSLNYTVNIKPEEIIPRKIIRDSLPLPGLSEIEVIRHYTRLTQESYGVDNGPVPLGSCTMKYNPRLALKLLSNEKLRNQPPITLETELAQGTLELIYYMQEWLQEITGMYKCSLQPPAGASGELSGVLIIKKYQKEKGRNRNEILIPDSAHGSNPASASMGGFKVVRIPTDEEGLVDLEALKASITDKTAGLMLTNPNTLGLFEKNIEEITRLLHNNDALVYYDGANLNGIIGIARPGDMGFDIVHLNLHKTFSSPHGGGGPGAGAVCVTKELADYLPGYIVEKKGESYNLKKPPKSIGDVSSAYGNLPGIVFAYTFLLSYGPDINKVAIHATYNTNYFLKLIEDTRGIKLPYARNTPRLHEAVLSFKELTMETGVTVEDIAKYLLNNGVHAPTIYFPLIVDEAFMIEFTETEPIETIEKYAEIIKKAVETSYKNPEELKGTPVNTSRKRVDGITANHPSTMNPSIVVEWKRRENKI